MGISQLSTRNKTWPSLLKVKYKTVKLLGDNTGESLDNLVYVDDFLDTLKAPSMNEIIDKLDFIKFKNLLWIKQENEKTGHGLVENSCKKHT